MKYKNNKRFTINTINVKPMHLYLISNKMILLKNCFRSFLVQGFSSFSANCIVQTVQYSTVLYK